MHAASAELSVLVFAAPGSVHNKARPEEAFTAPVEEEVTMRSFTAGKAVWLEAAHETILLVNTLSGLCQSWRSKYTTVAVTPAQLHCQTLQSLSSTWPSCWVWMQQTKEELACGLVVRAWNAPQAVRHACRPCLRQCTTGRVQLCLHDEAHTFCSAAEQCQVWH